MGKMMTAMGTALLAVSAFGNTIYVKPAACGTGDGSSWANAMGDARAAVIATLGGDAPRVIKLAKGIHQWSAVLYVGRNSEYGIKSFSIQGGFAGVSEDEDADITANPTYISFDANGDDRWVKRSLSTLATTGSATATDCGPIVDNGTVVWPDDSGDADALYAPDSTKVSDNVQFLKLNDNDAVNLSDLTFLGAGRGTHMETTACAGLYMKNVTYLGSCVNSTLCGFSNPASATLCDNVKLLWTHSSFATWAVGGQANRVFRHFDVKGYFYNGTMNGGGIFYCGGDGVGNGTLFRDCVFEKCYAGQAYSYKAQAIVFGLEKGSQVIVSNCTFRSICSRGNAVAAALSTRGGCANGLPRMRVVDCLFEDCQSYTAAASGEINNFGIVALASEASSLEGCTFRNNTVTVKPTGSASVARAGVVTLASPINTSETTSPHRMLVNCTFSGNAVAADTGSNDAGTTPRQFSRSVMVSSLMLSNPLDIVLAHCTFAGTASSEPDVVWTGVDESCKVRVLNSVFNGPATLGYAPVATSASGVLKVENSMLNGCTALPGTVSGTGNVFCELPLGDWDDLSGARVAPVLRPAARFPALRSAAKLGRFQSSGATYLTDKDDAHVYDDATSVTISGTIDPLLDAVGAAHPDGESTVGAVQNLTAAAESGATLFLTSTPAGAGTLTGGGTIQVVEKGAAVVSVTATSTDPSRYTFLSWQKPDGTDYSTDAELTISALNEDLQLTAVFSAPKTVYTFNLGAAGTFVENDRSTIVKELTPGSALTVPAFEIDEEHYKPVGWDVTPPETVGTEDRTFNYVTIEKLHRIVRVDCNLAEGGDGSTWAKAMTDVQAAIDKAAQWTGEVWIRQGVQCFAKAQTDQLVMANNVAILGGFEGVDGTYADVDAERAARDPELYETVLSADINADDPWTRNGQKLSQTVISDGRLNYPDFERGQVYYGMNIYYPNANYIFNNTDAALDETAVLDGVTLTSAISKNLQNGTLAHPTVRNCTFVGNGVKATSWQVISNCTFTAISGSAAVEFSAGTEAGDHGALFGCRFRYCNSAASGKGVFTYSCTGGFFEIRDTVFDQCTASRVLDIYGATIIGTEWGKGIVSGTTVRNCWTTQGVLISTPAAGCVVSNCLFEGNSCVQNASGAAVSTAAIPYVMMRNAQTSSDVLYCNTTFRSNTVSRTVGDNAGSKDGNAAILQAVGTMLVENCTFDGNTVTCTSPLEAYPATASVLLAPAKAYCGVVHSTFNGNTAADGDVGFIGRTGTAVSYIVNSILAGGEGHKPVTGTGNGAQVKLWNSVARHLDPSAAVLAESSGNVDADPRFMRKWRGEEPVLARRVGGTSPAVSLGRNVYLSGGKVCIPTDAEETAFINAATGAAVTPSAAKVALPDVFGAARPFNHFIAGSLQETGDALTILVR